MPNCPHGAGKSRRSSSWRQSSIKEPGMTTPPYLATRPSALVRMGGQMISLRLSGYSTSIRIRSSAQKVNIVPSSWTGMGVIMQQDLKSTARIIPSSRCVCLHVCLTFYNHWIRLVSGLLKAPTAFGVCHRLNGGSIVRKDSALARGCLQLRVRRVLSKTPAPSL